MKSGLPGNKRTFGVGTEGITGARKVLLEPKRALLAGKGSFSKPWMVPGHLGVERLESHGSY